MSKCCWMEKCFLCNGSKKIEVTADKILSKNTEEELGVQDCPCCEGYGYVMIEKTMKLGKNNDKQNY